MNTELEKWADESATNRQHFAQEGLILGVTEEIWAAMDRRGVNKLQLAERLGTGKSYISQLLNGARNMTLRTLSDIAEALDQQIEIVLLNKEEETQWKPVSGNLIRTQRFTTTSPIAANDHWTDIDGRRA